MKKTIAVLLTVLMLVMPFAFVSQASSGAPSRTINLVYDDSGSMIVDDSGVYVDRWCQAKYAMEVFAAMLGENDTLNIFFMSDYGIGSSGSTKAPGLTLQGSKDAGVTESNVQKVHDILTAPAGTPYAAVQDAYRQLGDVTTDEKWLVVLTDGEFGDRPIAQVGSDFRSFAEDGTVKVMMLAMGNVSVKALDVDGVEGVYAESAGSGNEILGKLTGICNQIFQNNELRLSGLSADVTVPMSQLIVFAQGKDAAIESVTDSQGNTFRPTSNVKVMYNPQPSAPGAEYSNDPQVVVADDLIGYVATFDTYLAPDTYTVNVTGADSVNVYYKPHVTIAAYLYNEDGEDITAEEHLVAGTYTVQYGFLDASTGEKVEDTSLLGNIEYSSIIKNIDPSGNENVMEVTAGEQVTITEGTLQIDVEALFLEYNVVHTTLNYDIFAKSDLIFALESNPTYKLNLNGFENPDDAIVLTVKKNNLGGEAELSAEEWALLETVEVITKDDLGEFRIEKSEEIGKFYIYPTLKDGDPIKTASGDIDIRIKGGFVNGLSSAQGELETTLKISSSISGADKFIEFIKRNIVLISVSLIGLILILGYIPPFKKYLPKKIKKRPLIECSAQKIGLKDQENHGSYKKNMLSTFIPYKPETGRITFSPSGHKKSISVKAAGKGAMFVTNTRTYAGKTEVTFNGTSIEEGRTKPLRISGNSTISLSTTEYIYTCYLNR